MPIASKRTRRNQLQFIILGAAGAGKTSLLRRFFHGNFSNRRAPTVGADFYVGTVSSGEEYLVQIWDTPGKENFASNGVTVLQDSFFENADAIMLVYDMTSSTSFTRLLRWYADLLELFQRSAPKKPILLVANKLDLYQNVFLNPHTRPIAQVPQRDVLGLSGKFHGKDFQYEYSVSPNSVASDDIATTTNANNNAAAPKRHAEISSYFLANRDNWTSDCSYLESLITAEDGSHPDRDMVLLWCLRNSVKLYEVSAATGDGVTEAFQALVALAAEANPNQEEVVIHTNGGRHKNKELDIRDRYKPQPKSVIPCFSIPFERCFKDTTAKPGAAF